MTNEKINTDIVWKDIPGFEGCYQINIMGQIRSLNRPVKGWNGTKIKKGRILKISYNPNNEWDYPHVSLSKMNKKHNGCIHKILAKVFIPNPCNKPFVLHKDDDRKNYSIDNIYWGNHKDNMMDRTLNKKTAIGERQGTSKLTNKKAYKIKKHIK